MIIEIILCVLKNYQKRILYRKGKFRIYEWNFATGSKGRSIMRYVGNSFSLQMLDSSDCTFKVTACEAPKPSENIHSIFGHSDIAAIAGYPVSRETVKLKKGDILYVLQLVSGRLAEGVTTLPESCKLKWMKVEIL